MQMNSEKSKPMHVQVAEKLIDQLKAGTAPWQKPWSNNGIPSFELPYNGVTGNRYKGINSLSLMLSEFEDPRWMTFKQAAANDWKVKKGEKGSLIQYVKLSDFVTKRDENGKPLVNEQGKTTKTQINLTKPIITNAWVFNATQIEGISPLKQLEANKISWEPSERAENLIMSSSAKIQNQRSESAFYSTVKDAITMPLKEQFSDASRYYATLLHELGHWTGHKDRLDRSLMNKFGSEEYAREELRAEIASLLVGQELRIGHDPGYHASYVDSWIKVLKQNPFEIHQAASDAEKIFDYLIGFEQKRFIANEVANQASSKVQNTDRLNVKDEIAYNNTVYKIQSHLKGGRFRVEDLNTSRQFTLSPNDGLYNSLLKAKQEPLSVTTAKQQQPEREEIELKSYSLKNNYRL